jgi:hypothetical protein
VWCSMLGIPDVPYTLPYNAQSPHSYDQRRFKTIDDVWDEVNLVEQNKFTLGQNLFHIVPLFAKPEWLFDESMAEIFKEYQITKKFNIPLSKSIDEADAFKLDCFLIIENEMNAIWQRKN